MEMTSKESIIASIKINKPAQSPLPEIPVFTASNRDLVNLFVDAAQKSGTTIITGKENLDQWLKMHYPENARILSLVPQFEGSVYADPNLEPQDLKHIDLAIIGSLLGVSENGAIWVSESDCQWRILPFIAENLLIFLKKEALVSNMHDAYQALKVHSSGFGVFIGGPSKTADIEQSLVVGAQGSRSHTIFLM